MIDELKRAISLSPAYNEQLAAELHDEHQDSSPDEYVTLAVTHASSGGNTSDHIRPLWS